MMPKVPKELKKQIEIFEGVIDKLNDVIDLNKIKMQYYGKDFQEPLTKIREDALALRSSMELFKNTLEETLTDQFYTNERFAHAVVDPQKVIDTFLSRSVK